MENSPFSQISFQEFFSNSIDFIAKIFATNYPDIDDFEPDQLNTWIKLINKIPRIPFLLIIEIACTCFLVKLLIKFNQPIFSFVISLIIASMTENLSSILQNRKYAIFENNLIAPFTLIAWILFNCFPFDLVFKFTKILGFLFYILDGFVIGHNLTLGIDQAIYMFPESSVYAIIFGILFGSARHILIYIVSRIKQQNAPSAGPMIFETSICALSYYYLTDLGHISYSFWFDKEEMRLYIIIAMSVFGLINYLVPPRFFTKCYDCLESIVFWIIPYYGSLWTPHSHRYQRLPHENQQPCPGKEAATINNESKNKKIHED